MDTSGHGFEGAAHALWYVAPRHAELRPETVSLTAAGSGSDHVVVRTLWSGISRGTERLVFQGLVPPSEFGRMRAPFQTGSFPFPVKYGYSAVGVVEKGPAELRGKTVFALHPHQSLFAVPRSSVAVLPGTVPARRGILAANMETALNGLWDSGASAGDRIAIVGAGALGCLVAGLAARIPGTEVIVIDKDHARGGAVRGLGADFIAADHARSLEADVVFHTSASGEGLSTSLQAAGFEARVLELSWYGEREVFARLGSDFHAKRLKLVSSQVGAVAESRRSRWSSSRRLEKALSLLNDPCLDALISEEIAFESLPEALPGLLAPDAPGIVTAVCYGQS